MKNYYSKLQRIIKNPYILIGKMIKGRAKFLNDKIYLKVIYRASFGENIDFDNPITYNQKLQYLKIHDRKIHYKKLVDKYEVREFVKESVGKEYLVPCYGVWDRFEDIDFNNLPNKFVIKCTHDSGSVIICKNKDVFDYNQAKIKINKWLRKNHYWTSREWPYKEIKPRIIIEKLLETEDGTQIRDYKFFCFSGIPKFLFIASDRELGQTNVKFDYFDIDFNRLNLKQTAHLNSNYYINKPKCYDQMVNVATKLSEGIPHVRLDLYEVNGNVYFGEFTFYHHGGFVPFVPSEYDYSWGKLIEIENL